MKCSNVSKHRERPTRGLGASFGNTRLWRTEPPAHRKTIKLFDSFSPATLPTALAVVSARPSRGSISFVPSANAIKPFSCHVIELIVFGPRNAARCNATQVTPARHCSGRNRHCRVNSRYRHRVSDTLTTGNWPFHSPHRSNKVAHCGTVHR